MKLGRKCRKMLDDAELRIERLTAETGEDQEDE